MTVHGDKAIQGLIAFKPVPEDQAYFADLIESNPANIGRNGRYDGIGGYLLATVAKQSFNAGYEGYVYFDAKTRLIDYYASEFGAKYAGDQRMYIDTIAAQALIDKYLKE